jgi:hypothetical protein
LLLLARRRKTHGKLLLLRLTRGARAYEIGHLERRKGEIKVNT